MKYNPKILVIGDLMVDKYLWGSCERISPEAPVQVVDIQKEELRLGGCGNVVNNLLALECKVGICSVIGNYDAGEFVKKRLQEKGVKLEALPRIKGRKTPVKTRIIASNQQVIRYDNESKDDISDDLVYKLLEILDDVIDGYDAIILSDYAKGVLTTDFCKSIIRMAKKSGKIVLVDPKGADFSKYSGATLLTPNKKEASIATKVEIKDNKSALKALQVMEEKLSLDYPLITLSEDGIAFLKNDLHIVPTIAQEVFDVTGAGDTVIASLAYALSSQMDIHKAVEFANTAAAVVVGKIGSTTASKKEILKVQNKNGDILENKIVTLSQLKLRLDYDKKIIFTNGCFDILHTGHIKYLNEAKKRGDTLVIGLNSDASVKRLKGENRPINNEEDRAYLLASLFFSDFIVIFDEDTPYELIKSIKPNVLVKGADYEGKEIVGSDLVDEVALLKFVEGKSSTNIINKIQGNK